MERAFPALSEQKKGRWGLASAGGRSVLFLLFPRLLALVRSWKPKGFVLFSRQQARRGIFGMGICRSPGLAPHSLLPVAQAGAQPPGGVIKTTFLLGNQAAGVGTCWKAQDQGNHGAAGRHQPRAST